MQQFACGLVESVDCGGQLRGAATVAQLADGLSRVPRQRGDDFRGGPERIVAPHQRTLTQIVEGAGDLCAGQHCGQVTDGDGVVTRACLQQGVEHREPQEIQIVGGDFDRLAGYRPSGQRRHAPRGGLGQVRPALQQADQLFVGKVGQPCAERGGHC